MDGTFRMQELHDQFGSLAVTADTFYPARLVQELRNVCVELEALGDRVVATRKTHAFFKALPDSHSRPSNSNYLLLLCERPCDGNALTFGDVASRRISFYAMQIPGEVQNTDDGTGSQSSLRAEHSSCARRGT